MFRPFPNLPSSGWIECRRKYIPTKNIVISVSVSTEKGVGGRDHVFKKQGLCVDWWWRLNACIKRVGIVRPTQLTNNGQTIPTRLIHVFNLHHQSAHTPCFL
jgi:hypothetical protein